MLATTVFVGAVKQGCSQGLIEKQILLISYNCSPCPLINAVKKHFNNLSLNMLLYY